MPPRLLLVLMLIAAAMSVACLGTLPADPRAEGVALAPQSEFGLPARDSRRHWLLRGESNWCGGHEVRYGGEPDDGGIASVRVVLFQDIDAAVAAFNRLTPGYLYNMLRGRILAEPQPITYGQELAGDAVSVHQYEVRLPLVDAPDATLLGLLTAVRSGRAVILVESIGVQPDHLVPAVRELVRAANRIPASEC
ncbi:MAG: hypothetical protein AB7R89_19940 [Dehalococcoidia bacterium]